VRIGKPPRRVRVSERDWVLREARALADEAKGGGKDGLNTPKAFRVKVSGNALEDVLVSVPTETGPEASLRVRGERYLDETPAHRAVDKALSRARASARYMYVEKAGPENGEAATREERAGEDARGDEASPPRTRRMLAEADEAEDAEDATVDDASSDASSDASPTSSSSRPASSSAKRAAASKAAERKRRSLEKSARARGELEDKANAMFQKLDDEVREMKTFMAEVVHKDDIGDAESLGGDDESLAEDEEDEEDAPDRSGDREAEGVGSADPDAARTRALNEKDSGEKRRSLEKRRDEEAEDAPLPVVEAGSEAAKRAAKRVSEGGGGGHESGSSAPSTVSVPDDFWSTAPERGGEAASASASASALPSAPATSDARASDPDAGDAAGDTAEDGDGGGYYEYELNYDAEAAEAEWSEKTYAFEAAEGAFVEREKQTREEQDERNRSVFDGESAAERSKRAAQVEERLKALVTPDKVLGYYNVPRAAVVTHPGATLGVAAFAGDATRLRATIWKYAEYFNVSVGAVRAVQQEDAIAAEAKRKAKAESEATTADVSGTVSGAAGEEAAKKPSASAEPGQRDDASASGRDVSSRGGEATLSRGGVSSFTGDSNGAFPESASTLGRVGASTSTSRGGGGGAGAAGRAGA
jgi:tripeptidyl-peptidase-1